MEKTIANINEENIRLKKIIAKELNENDELGSEYVFISILKNENEILNKKLKIAIEALENIKNKDNTLCPYCNEGQYHSWIAEEALEAIKDMGK